MLALVVILAVGVGGSAASAETNAISKPNGDFGEFVSVGTGTDRDGDGNSRTVTHGDTVIYTYIVYDRSGTSQAIEIEWLLDVPGTDLDQTGTKTVMLEPFGSYREVTGGFKVQKKVTPLGEYTFTVTARSGTETATTSETFTVHAMK
ncbi:hypothetical protein ACNAW0_29455 [Micromonospora sp. SL1-18]|uniref:hypothetical protein n=1 Tax=Micromonospora sp. SL1-18 TaxID=3399128 RepID=UPI003A4D54D8